MSAFPEITELLPHRGDMLLLSEVLVHTPEETVCAVAPDGGALFRDADGCVPSYLALEAMAQAAAVHAGLATRAGRHGPAGALLLGSRRLQLSTPRWAPDRALRVHARHQRGETGLVVFECALRDAAGGPSLAEARVSLYTVGEAASGERQHGG